jgi:predicted DNA-binding transcriptional regulator YafY
MTQDFLKRIERIDHLIKIRGTGTPEKFAERLGISRRCLYDYINRMKESGAPIKYDQYRTTFYYAEEGNFKIDFSFYKDEVVKSMRIVASYSSVVFFTQLF